jgi:hypothetical protein
MAGQSSSKRREAAAAKRRAVMSTKAFGEWWSARQHIHPVPSDPYRALTDTFGESPRAKG